MSRPGAGDDDDATFAAVDDQLSVLHEYLQYQREAVLAMVDGLADASMRATVLDFGWSPHGMIEHLGYAERHWFQEILASHAPPLAWDDEPALTSSRSPAEAIRFYREQCRISDAAIEASSAEDRPVGRHLDEPLATQTSDLGRIVLHMIEETARHAGHLDLARQLIDGRTGLGRR